MRLIDRKDFGCKVSTGIILFLMLACQGQQSTPFQLEVTLRNAQPGVLYLYRLSGNQDPVMVDSFSVTKLDEHFTLKDQSPWRESLYQLSIPNWRSTLYYVSDAARVKTQIDGVEPRRYTTQGSAASQALQTLQQIQNPLQDSMTILNNKINNGIGDAASLRQQFGTLQAQSMQHYFTFADTTKQTLPALFIAQQLDFGTDLSKHNAFIARLEKRFAGQPLIQDFVQKTKNYFALREVEYAIGERPPSAQFTDLRGAVQKPTAWKGNYYLLQFWASYCANCLADLQQKRKVYQSYHPKGFQMLTFSLDQDPAMLNEVLNRQFYPWPVVCDYQGWASAGVNTYKIDSIPFNILVGPDGIIQAKNVDAPQLEEILRRGQK